MFDTIIDTVQSTKKTFISTVITNSELKSSINNYIDAETSVAKTLANLSTDFYKNYKFPFNSKKV